MIYLTLFQLCSFCCCQEGNPLCHIQLQHIQQCLICLILCESSSQRSFLLYFSPVCSFISVSHLFSFTLSPDLTALLLGQFAHSLTHSLAHPRTDLSDNEILVGKYLHSIGSHTHTPARTRRKREDRIVFQFFSVELEFAVFAHRKITTTEGFDYSIRLLLLPLPRPFACI